MSEELDEAERKHRRTRVTIAVISVVSALVVIAAVVAYVMTRPKSERLPPLVSPTLTPIPSVTPLPPTDWVGFPNFVSTEVKLQSLGASTHHSGAWSESRGVGFILNSSTKESQLNFTASDAAKIIANGVESTRTAGVAGFASYLGVNVDVVTSLSQTEDNKTLLRGVYRAKTGQWVIGDSRTFDYEGAQDQMYVRVMPSSETKYSVVYPYYSGTDVGLSLFELDVSKMTFSRNFGIPMTFIQKDPTTGKYISKAENSAYGVCGNKDFMWSYADDGKSAEIFTYAVKDGVYEATPNNIYLQAASMMDVIGREVVQLLDCTANLFAYASQTNIHVVARGEKGTYTTTVDVIKLSDIGVTRPLWLQLFDELMVVANATKVVFLSVQEDGTGYDTTAPQTFDVKQVMKNVPVGYSKDQGISRMLLADSESTYLEYQWDLGSKLKK